MPQSSQVHAPQYPEPLFLESRLCNEKKTTTMRSLHTSTKSSPCLPQLEKAWVQLQRPSTTTIAEVKMSLTYFFHLKTLISEGPGFDSQPHPHPLHDTSQRRYSNESSFDSPPTCHSPNPAECQPDSNVAQGTLLAPVSPGVWPGSDWWEAVTRVEGAWGAVWLERENWEERMSLWELLARGDHTPL